MGKFFILKKIFTKIWFVIRDAPAPMILGASSTLPVRRGRAPRSSDSAGALRRAAAPRRREGATQDVHNLLFFVHFFETDDFEKALYFQQVETQAAFKNAPGGQPDVFNLCPSPYRDRV